MAATESLKKIIYENLQQFTEDINRNFAIIQNSPLYKGIPGDPGEPGSKGLVGERGSHFYFVKLSKFLEIYPGQIVNGSSINIDWINTQLKSNSKEIIDKLYKALGVVDNKFVNNDVIVLTNSLMIEYDVVNDVFVSTGVSFYQQGSLVTSIEQRIEEYVKLTVDNNSIIKSLKNIFVDYNTFEQLYEKTANTYITNKQADSSIYVPSLNGQNNFGSPVNNHKYFGFNTNQVSVDKASTTVFGSIDAYITMLNNGLSVIGKNNYTSNYLPNVNNIPTLVVLQDTDNNGILFGCKKYDSGKVNGDLIHFGSIFKDSKPINDIHIKSDQGTNISDFSEILLNRYRLKYDKYVEFGDTLLIKKDLQVNDNFNTKWIRTSEYILTKYNNINQRENVIEVGYIGLDDLKKLNFGPTEDKSLAQNYLSETIYRNISKQIELPNFSNDKKRVVLTVESENDKLCNDYFIETQYTNINNLNNTELDNITFLESEDSDKYILTSKHFAELVKKINYIQEYVKENFWRRREWEGTNRNNKTKNNRIELLNINELNVYSDTILGNDTNNYFISNIKNKTVTIGFENSESKLFVKANGLINIDFYKNLISNSEANIVASTNNGNLIKEFGIFNKYVYQSGDESNKNIDLYYFVNLLPENSNKLIPTLNQIGLLATAINSALNNTNTTTWRKSDYTKNADVTTGKDKVLPIEEGNIPNIYVKYLLGGKQLNIVDLDNSVKLITGKTTNLKCNTFIVDSLINVPKLSIEKFVTTDNSNNLVTIYEKFITFESPTIDTFDSVINYTIKDAGKKILTADDWLWINQRINNVITKVNKDYWRKIDFAPEDGPVIPKLSLSDSFEVYGTFEMGPKDNLAISFNNNSLLLGQKDAGKIEFISNSIKLINWARKINELNNKVLVTDNEGNLSKEYFLCEDSEDTEHNGNLYVNLETLKSETGGDNFVPESSKDLKNFDNKADVKKKINPKYIITGSQWKWLQNFINNVKHRFINTFNKKETIDFIYDHMPVGSIIMWTQESYNVLVDSLQAKGLSLDKIHTNYIDEKTLIPYGWQICNGSQLPTNNTKIYTPDFRDRFPLGVDTWDKSKNINVLGGKDEYNIKRENLPELNHYHICTDTINEHTHTLTTNPNKAGDFTLDDDEYVWSTKKLYESPDNAIQHLMDKDNNSGYYFGNKETTVNGNKVYKLSTGFNKANFELPLMYKKSKNYNLYGPVNFRHDKDGSGKTWRRYDFDITRNDSICLSANLTTIFKNFGATFNINSQKVIIEHVIQNCNIGTGTDAFNNDSGKYSKQEPLLIKPKYRTVMFIMKYDTRIDTKTESKTYKHDTRYDLTE